MEKDASAMQVEIEIYKGVVWLSGFVDNDCSRKKVGQLAKKMAGVTCVGDVVKRCASLLLGHL
jgi:osmotically-inducible protein OsmY